MEATVKWVSDMSFTGEQNGHEITLDAGVDSGGKDGGPRPKTLMLTALGGCTGMDVISILRKMRVIPDGFSVRVSAELTGEHPRVFSSIHLEYLFRGKDLPLDKLEKAVALSQEQYCGVTAMLARVCPITHDIRIETP